MAVFLGDGESEEGKIWKAKAGGKIWTVLLPSHCVRCC